jgi:hypothetical protein
MRHFFFPAIKRKVSCTNRFSPFFPPTSWLLWMCLSMLSWKYGTYFTPKSTNPMKFEIDIGWFSGCHPCLRNFAVDGDDAEIDKNDILEEPTTAKEVQEVEEEAVVQY